MAQLRDRRRRGDGRLTTAPPGSRLVTATAEAQLRKLAEARRWLDPSGAILYRSTCPGLSRPASPVPWTMGRRRSLELPVSDPSEHAVQREYAALSGEGRGGRRGARRRCVPAGEVGGDWGLRCELDLSLCRRFSRGEKGWRRHGDDGDARGGQRGD
jgi:hypothetical protein